MGAADIDATLPGQHPHTWRFRPPPAVRFAYQQNLRPSAALVAGRLLEWKLVAKGYLVTTR
jgi:hypothetical protein